MTFLFEKAISVIGWFESGSRVICDPPPTDTDHDFVIYTDSKSESRRELEALGYTRSNKDYKASKTDPFAMYNSFDSYRHTDNDHNLIVVFGTGDFKRWKVATQLATLLNVTDKDKRVALFRAVRSAGTMFPAVELKEAAPAPVSCSEDELE